MKKGIRQGVIVILVFITLAFTSCTTNIEQPIEETKEVDLTPVQGGALSFSILTPTHLNPILNQEEDSYHVMKLIFEPLLFLDEDYKIKGKLAKEWVVEENGEKIIFHLQENVFWQDDEPFTTEDVKFTLDALKNKDVTSPYAAYVENISSYKIIDDHSIEISFSNGQSGNLESFTFPILPAHRYKNTKDVMTAHKWSPMGTGPYRLERFQQGKEIRLKVNEKYWGKVPYIENILAKIRMKNDQIVKSFESKDVDLLRAVDKDWNRFGEDTQLTIYPYSIQRYNFIGLNQNHEAFKEVKVRQAIQKAINREEMITDIYYNQADAVDIPLSPSSWLYDAQQKPYSYNLKEAKKLLEESGWQDTNNNKLVDKEIDEEKTELTFELIIPNKDDNKVQEAKMIKRNLEDIGIGVDILQLSMEKINENMADKEFDGILINWDLSFVPDLSFAFHSKEIEEGMNFISYKNKEVDKLLIEASRIHGEQERREKYSQLQREISQELPYINLFFNRSALIVNNRIKGNINPTDYNLFNNIEEWFIEYK